MRVLLVEDDASLGAGLQTALRSAGYTVDLLTDGNAAVLAAEHGHAEAMVLDLGLPRLDGMQVIQRLRAQASDLPILVLTARDRVSERVAALDAGADDFLGKPFDLSELQARLRALIRRRAGRRSETLSCGSLVLDPAKFEARIDGQRLELPRREFALLRLLVEGAGRVVSKDALQQHLYGWDDDVGSNALEVHVHHLRKKLPNDWIRTVRGVGYMLIEQPGAA
ncbi:response regulator [Pseudomarimonas arenosa]|uniref:Response regulator transcription factor n=1 Tax=Pseudomarimonas arenosa TaxID=2774145 RepID=A0AAW3ZKP3_9GAMM|nr:response regulator transcription factor [Pseudomarimonas arenosa]